MGSKKPKIDSDILKETKLCGKNHACLDRADSLCPVNFSVADNMLFVSKDINKACNYYTPFGYGGLCNCPVRKKLYSDHNR